MGQGGTLPDTTAELLDLAVNEARTAGVAVSGWTMQSGEGGYAAWLYIEDDETQRSILDEVELHTSARAAALWCLERARALVSS